MATNPTLNDLQKAHLSCNVTEVDLATNDDVVVTAARAILLGIYVLIGNSAHAVIFKNTSTTKLTIPASQAAGINIDCKGVIFDDNITVQSDDSATGKLLVFWSAI
jgi:hypothetical protein